MASETILLETSDLLAALTKVAELKLRFTRLHVQSALANGDIWFFNGEQVVWAETPNDRGLRALLTLLSTQTPKLELAESAGVPCDPSVALRINLSDVVQNCAQVVQHSRDAVQLQRAHEQQRAMMTPPSFRGGAASHATADGNHQSQNIGTANKPVDISQLSGRDLAELLRAEVQSFASEKPSQQQPQQAPAAEAPPSTQAPSATGVPSPFGTPSPFVPPPQPFQGTRHDMLQASPGMPQEAFESGTFGRTFVRDENMEMQPADMAARLNQIIEKHGKAEEIEPQPTEQAEPEAPPQPVQEQEEEITPENAARRYMREKSDQLRNQQNRKNSLALEAEESSKGLIDRDTSLGPDTKGEAGFKGTMRKLKTVPVSVYVTGAIVVMAIPMFIIGAIRLRSGEADNHDNDAMVAAYIADQQMEARVQADKPEEPFRLPAGGVSTNGGGGPNGSPDTPDVSFKPLTNTQTSTTTETASEADTMAAEANQLMTSGKYLEAAGIYSVLIAKDPKQLSYRKSAIKAYIAAKEYSQARSLCYQGLTMTPNEREKQQLQDFLSQMPP